MELDDIKKEWAAAKASRPAPATGTLEGIRKKVSHSRQAHRANALVLIVTCLVLIWFFRYIAPLQDTLSHVGIMLMIGGLVVRILIEWWSHQRSTRLRFAESTNQAATDVRLFYQWRQRIHGPVTLTILLLYSIGFYMLSPEFSRYFSLPVMVLMDGSYVVIFIVLFFVIRRGVKQEMEHLRGVMETAEQLGMER